MLEMQNLGKCYQGHFAVQEVSLRLKERQVISFIGPNGAGKSTVLNMLSRLIPRDEGEIYIDEQPLELWDQSELAKTMAILTQSSNISARISVRDLIGFGRFPYCKGRLGPEDEEMVDKALAFMQLEDLVSRFIDELSGGQRQRALIAMVLAQDTKYVLLDEPTNNLDIYHASHLMQSLRRLCDELNKTVVLVLHELNLASAYSDEICVFKDGRLLKSGTPQEIVTEDFLSSVYQVDFSVVEHHGRPLVIYS